MKLIAVLAASTLSVAAFAQTQTATVDSGLIGSRYVSAGFGWTDINHSSVEGMSTGLDVNLPLNANFDLSLDYSYAWLEGAVDVGHTVDAGLTGYIARGQDKYFAEASLGYSWIDGRFDDDHAVWGVAAGIERSVSDKVSCTLSAGYDDDFGNHREGSWDGTVGATYSFTAKLVGQASVSLIEGGSIGYAAGVAYRF